MQFSFTERAVSFPRFDVEAKTLEEACRLYRERSDDGDDPDEEPVNESTLVSVYQNGERIPDEEARAVLLDLSDEMAREECESDASD